MGGNRGVIVVSDMTPGLAIFLAADLIQDLVLARSGSVSCLSPDFVSNFVRFPDLGPDLSGLLFWDGLWVVWIWGVLGMVLQRFGVNLWAVFERSSSGLGAS